MSTKKKKAETLYDTEEYLQKMDAYFRAANYLSACQLYLLDDPLLKEPLKPEMIKKKIVGHWGTVPGAGNTTPGNKVYLVKKGDNLTKIARELNVTINHLVSSRLTNS